jgi:hypothetical protein
MDRNKYNEICKEYGIRLTINPENYTEQQVRNLIEALLQAIKKEKTNE